VFLLQIRRNTVFFISELRAMKMIPHRSELVSAEIINEPPEQSEIEGVKVQA